MLPFVWAMCRKQNLATNKITKYKARLNTHSGKQNYGVNYYETYAPIVTSFAVCLMIVFAVLFSWSPKQVDFVMAYYQAPHVITRRANISCPNHLVSTKVQIQKLLYSGINREPTWLAGKR